MMNLGKGFRVSRTAELDENYISAILCIQVEIEDMETDEAYECLESFDGEITLKTDSNTLTFTLNEIAKANLCDFE